MKIKVIILLFSAIGIVLFALGYEWRASDVRKTFAAWQVSQQHRYKSPEDAPELYIAPSDFTLNEMTSIMEKQKKLDETGYQTPYEKVQQEIEKGRQEYLKQYKATHPRFDGEVRSMMDRENSFLSYDVTATDGNGILITLYLSRQSVANSADDGRGIPDAMASLSPSQLRELIASVNKSAEWATLSHQNHLTVPERGVYATWVGGEYLLLAFQSDGSGYAITLDLNTPTKDQAWQEVTNYHRLLIPENKIKTLAQFLTEASIAADNTEEQQRAKKTEQEKVDVLLKP
jgi:hypothetical protein